ncbi:MAG: hypothetical protein ACK5S0_00125 [bacterium]
MQDLAQHYGLAARCGHPDLGGHCNLFSYSVLRVEGAATLIAGGHCN